MNVLLVQEDPEEVRKIESMLKEAAGETFRIHWMSRLSTALERLRERGLDVVLYDLGFADDPRLDNLTQLQAAFPQVPVVVLTVEDNAAQGVEAVQWGAQDVLPKCNLSGDLLARSLRYAFERKHRRTATEAEDGRGEWHRLIWANRAMPLPADIDRSEPSADPASGDSKADPTL